jgi:hypothetical protein
MNLSAPAHAGQLVQWLDDQKICPPRASWPLVELMRWHGVESVNLRSRGIRYKVHKEEGKRVVRFLVTEEGHDDTVHHPGPARLG